MPIPETSHRPEGPPPPLPTVPTVVVAASTAALVEGRAPKAALDLARSWSDRGRHVLLVDGDLAAPSLHAALGLEGSPGLGDVLAGASTIERAARPVEGSSLALVPAGSFPLDPFARPGGALVHAVMGSIPAGGSGCLVLYLPAEEPWAAPFLERAEEIFLLATGGESAVDVLGRLDAAVTVMVPGEAARREGAREPAAPPRPADPEPLPPAPAEAEGAATAEAEGPGPAPPPEGTGTARRHRSDDLPIWIVALAVLGLLGVVWVGSATSWFGLSSRKEPVVPPTTAAPPGGQARQEAAQPLFTIRLGSFQDRENAMTARDAVAEAEPGMWVAVTPVEVRGSVFYRVLAGLEPDSASALALRESLSTALGEDPAGWVAQRATWAYLLAETEDSAQAQRRLDGLLGQDVSAYLAVEEPGGGSHTYRVYAGAFADTAEARHLGDLLRRLNVRAELVERR